MDISRKQWKRITGGWRLFWGVKKGWEGGNVHGRKYGKMAWRRKKWQEGEFGGENDGKLCVKKWWNAELLVMSTGWWEEGRKEMIFSRFFHFDVIETVQIWGKCTDFYLCFWLFSSENRFLLLIQGKQTVKNAYSVRKPLLFHLKTRFHRWIFPSSDKSHKTTKKPFELFLPLRFPPQNGTDSDQKPPKNIDFPPVKLKFSVNSSISHSLPRSFRYNRNCNPAVTTINCFKPRQMQRNIWRQTADFLSSSFPPWLQTVFFRLLRRTNFPKLLNFPSCLIAGLSVAGVTPVFPQ